MVETSILTSKDKIEWFLANPYHFITPQHELTTLYIV